MKSSSDENIRLISLTQDRFAIVDAEDFEWLNQWKWYACKNLDGRFYVIRREGTKKVRLHRFIMKPHNNLVVDHINGDGLDNRRLNLRICTSHQNNCNRRKLMVGVSEYKGITFLKTRKKWRACIMVNKKTINSKRFKTEIEAAIAYNDLAIKHFGEFAQLNKVHSCLG